MDTIRSIWVARSAQKPSRPWPPLGEIHDPEWGPPEATVDPGSCELYVLGAYNPGNHLPAKPFIKYCKSKGSNCAGDACASMKGLCDTIAGYAKDNGPFCRITVSGHCGEKLKPCVMLSENERFQCDSISDECGK